MTTPYDTPQHVRGQSLFLDDLLQPKGCLHAAIVPSPVACGELRDVDISQALRMEGVVSVLTADDIPGQNQIGTVIQDEPLLAQGEVHFMGQPVALVAARSARLARQAAKAVKPRIDVCKPVFDSREAAALGRFIAPSRTLALGDVDKAWSACAHVVTGRADSGGQEHLYLEPQGALALPQEKGGVQLYSSTQSPTAVQRVTASVLGLAMHDVQVEVGRLGGAFGGKEDQATAYAALAALAAFRTGKPVKLVLERHEDMRLTGKRHPYSSDFKLGLDADGRILAYEVTFFQDAGAAADLSLAILERSLYHATGAYFIPNARITGHSCKTNHVPNTAFRGFGGPQAMFVMESAIARAAEHMGLPAWQIQERNLLKEGDCFPYGAQAEQCHARRSFNEAKNRFEWERVLAETTAFNHAHSLVKKGVALMPICFGISFTTTFLNQAGALVHVYTDGSVSVATAAVEMGQGVYAKVRRIVALALGVDESKVTLQPTSTRTVANTSPTAASTATDLNGAAARLAALAIRQRLLTVAGSLLNPSSEKLDIRDGRVWQGDRDAGLAWTNLVQAAYQRRVDLSAHALYATPGIHYDKAEEKGRPLRLPRLRHGPGHGHGGRAQGHGGHRRRAHAPRRRPQPRPPHRSGAGGGCALAGAGLDDQRGACLRRGRPPAQRLADNLQGARPPRHPPDGGCLPGGRRQPPRRALNQGHRRAALSLRHRRILRHPERHPGGAARQAAGLPRAPDPRTDLHPLARCRG